VQEDGFYVATRIVNPILVKYRHFIAETYGLGALIRPREYLHISDVALHARLEELRDELALGRITRDHYAREIVKLLAKYPHASQRAIEIVSELYEALTGGRPLSPGASELSAVNPPPLRELPSQTPAGPQGVAVCPSCGREATLLRTLGRYYCFNCKRYVT